MIDSYDSTGKLSVLLFARAGLVHMPSRVWWWGSFLPCFLEGTAACAVEVLLSLTASGLRWTRLTMSSTLSCGSTSPSWRVRWIDSEVAFSWPIWRQYELPVVKRKLIYTCIKQWWIFIYSVSVLCDLCCFLVINNIWIKDKQSVPSHSCNNYNCNFFVVLSNV